MKKSAEKVMRITAKKEITWIFVRTSNFFFSFITCEQRFLSCMALTLTKSSVSLVIRVVALFFTDDFCVAVIDCKFVATG